MRNVMLLLVSLLALVVAPVAVFADDCPTDTALIQVKSARSIDTGAQLIVSGTPGVIVGATKLFDTGAVYARTCFHKGAYYNTGNPGNVTVNSVTTDVAITDLVFVQ